MPTNSISYKHTGLQRLAHFKQYFIPAGKVNNSIVEDFVNLFCEYQLADNNYMGLQQEAMQHSRDEQWFFQLDMQETIRYITYIVWTDRLNEGFLQARIKDRTMYNLLSRLEQLTCNLNH